MPKPKVWTIPEIPLTLNRWANLHWRGKGRYAKKWRELVYIFTKGNRKPPAHAKVSIVVHRARKQDPDNRVGSVKKIVDALVANGWLADDTDKNITLEVEEKTECRRDRQRTVITWEATDE